MTDHPVDVAAVGLLEREIDVEVPAPDETSIAEHVSWWFGGCQTGRLVGSAFSSTLRKSGVHQAFDVGDPAAVARWLAGQARAGHHAYIRQTVVRPDWTGPGRGSAGDTVALPGVWLDVDIAGPGHKSDRLPDADTAHRLVRSLPSPSRLVDSGAGLYPFWKFDEPILIDDTNRDEVAAKVARFTIAAQAIWGDHQLDSCQDLARILRAPGCVNLKPGVMRQVRLIVEGSTYPSLDVLVDTVEAMAPEVPTRPATPRTGAPRLQRARSTSAGGTSFADRFGEHNTFADIANILDKGPWTYVGMDHHRELWKRDGTSTEYSVKYDPTASTVIVWSDTVAAELDIVGGDAVSLLEFAAAFTDNSMPELRSAIGTEAYNRAGGRTAGSVGGKLAEYLNGMIDDLADADRAKKASNDPDHGDGAEDEATTAADSDDNGMPVHLPEAFWNARESLRQVRRYAYSNGAPADATLATIFARIAAATPPSVVVKPNAKPPISLNFAVVILGRTGSGKSTSVSTAKAAIQSSVIELDNAPAGSAEGLIESYMGTIDEPYQDAEGEPQRRKVRGQAKRSCLFYVDEGEEFITKAGRDGSTLFTTLRAMVSGNDVGSMNATAERTRHLGAHRYRFVFVAGFQPGRADTILDDSDGGTPQRFLWTQATDPNIPFDPDDVDSLDWQPRADNLAWLTTRHHGKMQMGILGFPEDIGGELYREAIRRARGDETLDVGDSHRPVLCVKVAALLCLLENRTEITVEDWGLAEIVVDVSTNVRRAAEADKRRRAVDKERRAAEREGERQLVTAATVKSRELSRVERVAAVIARKAHKKPGEHLDVRKFRDAVRKPDRELVTGNHVAITYAVDEGWITAHESGWTAGPEVPPDA